MGTDQVVEQPGGQDRIAHPIGGDKQYFHLGMALDHDRAGWNAANPSAYIRRCFRNGLRVTMKAAVQVCRGAGSYQVASCAVESLYLAARSGCITDQHIWGKKHARSSHSKRRRRHLHCEPVPSAVAEAG